MKRKTSSAEGRYRKGDGDADPEKRAGIFVGPECGTVSRPDLVAAAREAGDAGFDVLIAYAHDETSRRNVPAGGVPRR